MTASKIIYLYHEECHEHCVEPLKEHTCFRLLEVWSTSKQKSLQGLDSTSTTWCWCNIDPRHPSVIMGWKELSQKCIQESCRTGRALCWSLYCVCTIGSSLREIFRWMLPWSQPDVFRMQGYCWCSESYQRHSQKWRSGLEGEAKGESKWDLVTRFPASMLEKLITSYWGLSNKIKRDKIPYLFDYKPISAISQDPKLWTCRLGITRTKNKSKTPGYKPRPIHYYKTELLTTGKPNIFGKKSHWLS